MTREQRREALLRRAGIRFRYLERMFNGPQFSDRGNDGPAMKKLADEIEAALAEPIAHRDHPLRHWDRTCPACLVEQQAP